MAHKEEVEPNIYLIPKNSFDTGYVLGGQFRTRNFVEGIILALPFLGIFAYGWVKLGWDFRSTIAQQFSFLQPMVLMEIACLNS